MPEIEVPISHLKHSHQLKRNYLKGAIGDIMNGLLAAIGYNLHLLLLEIGKRTTNNPFIFFSFSLTRIYINLGPLVGSLHPKVKPRVIVTS